MSTPFGKCGKPWGMRHRAACVTVRIVVHLYLVRRGVAVCESKFPVGSSARHIEEDRACMARSGILRTFPCDMRTG